MKVLLLTTALVLAHEWYPRSCCGDNDCHPVDCDELAEQEGGAWVYLPTGNLFSRDKVRVSEDRHCHVCINNTNSMCAFILTGS